MKFRNQSVLTKWSCVPLAAALYCLAGAADPKEHPAFTNPDEAGPDFAIQGEYTGELDTSEGKQKIGVQVIALGDGKFRAAVHFGGLPGDGWEKGQKRDVHDSEVKNGVTVFPGDEGEGRIEDGLLSVFDSGGRKTCEFERVLRESPTLGARPPEGAVVLFDGSTAENFEGGKLTEDGLLEAGCRSKQSFGSCLMHLEFRTPFMPKSEGQARGNSGVYIADLYEFQVLDSFGLEGLNNECAGLYSIAEPRVNMCFPPLSWQTYDFDFTAPRFDDAGDKVANARVTLKHNGVVVHDDLEIPHLTPGGRDKEAPTGPLQLQNHGNPVHFRNIWVVEKKIAPPVMPAGPPSFPN